MLDSLSLVLVALTGIRFLGMLLFVNMYSSKRESKYLVLIFGWLIGTIGSAWGIYTHLAFGEMASFSVSLLAAISTFLLGSGALMYFNAITIRAILLGTFLILAYSLLPFTSVLSVPLPGVLAQIVISLVVTFAVLFRRKKIWSVAFSSYFWLVAMAILSVALTIAFGVGVFAGDNMALGFVGTGLIHIVAIIFFLHLEHNMSTLQVSESKERYKFLFDFAPVALFEEDMSELLQELNSLKEGGVHDLRAYIAEHPDFPLQIMRTMKVTDINQQCARLFGADSMDAVTFPPERTFQPESWRTFTEALLAIFEGGQPFFEEETVIQTLAGERRYVIMRMNSPSSSDDSTRSLIGMTDITERHLLQAQLQQTHKLESIGTLASGVAHEINNPLMGMLNYAELIGDAGDETLKHRSQMIIKEGNRIATIVRNLLSFARQDQEEHSPAAMVDIIDSSLSLVGSILRKAQTTVELDIPDDLPLVKCRSQQIEQVVINLLTNARDALNKRYPDYDPDKRVRISAHPFTKNGVDWIRTTIEDHGTGIPAEEAQRIFDPFFTTKSRNEGTGLGLSVSFGIVREHHGELSVESVPNEYTRFHMDLRVNNGWSLNERKIEKT